MPTPNMAGELEKKLQELEKALKASKIKERVQQQLNSLAKKHNLRFRDDNEANARLIRQKIARYVEANGGKLIETPKGLKAVSAVNPENDLVINKKVFNLDAHIQNIFPKMDKKSIPAGNKPQKIETEKALNERPKGYDSFSNHINQLINQFA